MAPLHLLEGEVSDQVFRITKTRDDRELKMGKGGGV